MHAAKTIVHTPFSQSSGRKTENAGPRTNILFSAIALFISFLSPPCYGANKPNILLFLGDNWSWQHASVMGDPIAKTPVFDRIAREGILFNNAFCPVPSCSPTRSCLLTGRAAHQLKEAASLWSAFPTTHQVFTESLRQAGYEVGYCGKGWSPGRYLEFGWKENPVGTLYKDFAEFMAKRDQAKPFFFWNGNVDTSLHKWKDEQEGWSQQELRSVKVPPELPDSEVVRGSMLGYYKGLSRVDADAGRCISELEQRALLDETLVIYTSDNGWQQPRGLANCYDTGTHVPMAIRWGTKIPAGRIVDDFVSLTDLAPTFLDIAGIQPTQNVSLAERREPSGKTNESAKMTGRSFLDVISGKPSHVNRDHVFVERERHANVRRGDLSYPIRGIRTKDFLYLWNMRPDRWPAGDPKVYYAVGDFGDVDGSRAKDFILANRDAPEMKRFFELNFAKRPEVELFDLRKDPHQLTNVADREEYAAVQKQLRARVEQWMRDTDDPRVDPNYDEWDKYAYYGGTVVDKDGNLKEKAEPKKKKVP
jgi:N-sulfoglucosamine sulfohydrolase